MKRKIEEASLTRKGFVSLWEEGGSYRNTGSARIICKADGSMPTATYICRRGHLSCGEHALVPVHEGFYVIESDHHRGDFAHQIFKVVRTFTKEVDGALKGFVEMELVNSFYEGEWDAPLEHLEAAVAAAEEKAATYHCRDPYYVVEKEKND